MIVHRIEPTDAIRPFLSDLRLPKGFNGKINSNRFIEFFHKNGFRDVDAETCKRFQDVYNTIAGARLSVALAQKKEFPEIVQPDEWGYNWIRSRYVTDAILLYEATFDLLLQIPWIYFQVYKLNDDKLELGKDLDVILRSCRLRKKVIYDKNGNVCNIKFGLKDKIAPDLYSLINTFHKKDNVIISKLANYIKHKQCISFKELKLQNNFVVLGNNYNSVSSLEEYPLDSIIAILKKHHMKLVELGENLQKFFPY